MIAKSKWHFGWKRRRATKIKSSDGKHDRKQIKGSEWKWMRAADKETTEEQQEIGDFHSNIVTAVPHHHVAVLISPNEDNEWMWWCQNNIFTTFEFSISVFYGRNACRCYVEFRALRFGWRFRSSCSTFQLYYLFQTSWHICTYTKTHANTRTHTRWRNWQKRVQARKKNFFFGWYCR